MRIRKGKRRKCTTLYIYYKVREPNYLSNYGRQRTTSTATTPCSASHTTCPPGATSSTNRSASPSCTTMTVCPSCVKLVSFKTRVFWQTKEDAETHLLRTKDWMETHIFPEEVKVQRFCLALMGELRLWYESLRPIVID